MTENIDERSETIAKHKRGALICVCQILISIIGVNMLLAVFGFYGFITTFTQIVALIAGSMLAVIVLAGYALAVLEGGK